MEHFQKGDISPIRPVKLFDAVSPYHAFKYMQPGQHVGRICMCESPESTNLDGAILDRPNTLKLCALVTYLLVGGLGGLGRAIYIVVPSL